MNLELNKKNIIMLAVFVLIIITGLLLHDYRNQDLSDKINNKITLVNDYSQFFTISNAGNKYISYLLKKDNEKLMFLLNEKYISVNSITKENILNKLTLLESGSYTFEARKIYQERLSSDITRYYIKGDLSLEIMDEYQRPSDYYLIIEMDSVNNTFEVTPYNGKIFMEA
ncbi:MAG: hypothetical protein PHG03_01215 [Bacilli bacterium]|nr:hypothetical protein [Bacilli bacterium]MDD4795165.1 hypothetical protein [Bacilli bacterium]